MIKDREIRKAIERQILAHKRKKKKAAYDKLEEFIYSKEKEMNFLKKRRKIMNGGESIIQNLKRKEVSRNEKRRKF